MDSVTIQQLPKFGGTLTGLEPLETVKDDVSVSITTGQIADIAIEVADAALQAAMPLKADLISPALAGTPTAPTAAPGTNSQQLANAAFVQAAVAKAVTDLVNASPTALDTLKELADAIGDDPNFATTMLNALAQKVGVTQIAASTGAAQVGAILPDGSSGTTQAALDALKAGSTGNAAALALKAPLASPTLTGTPLAPTAGGGTNTDQIATTAFVRSAIAALVDSSPGALDTLNELAAALGNDPNFATTITASLGLKAPLASPALTGAPTAPTATAGTNTTQLATTAFVQAVSAAKDSAINVVDSAWKAFRDQLYATNGTSYIGYQGTMLDQFLNAGIGHTVASVAAMRLQDTTKVKNFQTAGYYGKGTRGGAFYYVDDADTTSADDGGSVIVANDGGRIKLNHNGAANSAQWGAKGDRTADDTARLQAAVNWCHTFTRTLPLHLVGSCLVTSALIVNRPVDASTNEFRIVSATADAGLHSKTAITLFDSTITMGVDPVSEFVTLEGINITGEILTTNPVLFSKKFLRLKILNCFFKNSRFMTTDSYAQSVYFAHCNIRTWDALFFVAHHAFDIDFDGCISEFGNSYLTSFANGTYNVRFRGGVHEGSVGGLIASGANYSCSVNGYYCEANAQPALQFGVSSQNKSVSVQNSFFASTPANVANSNFFEIAWGDTLAAVSISNHQFNGRLHDNSGLGIATPLISIGDTAAISIAKDQLKKNQSEGAWIPASTLGTGTANFGHFRRMGGKVYYEFSFTFSGASGSPAVISGLLFPALGNIIGGSVSYTDLTGEVYLIGGSGAGNGCTSTSFAICSNKSGTAITYTTIQGKTVVGRIEYAIAV